MARYDCLIRFLTLKLISFVNSTFFFLQDLSIIKSLLANLHAYQGTFSQIFTGIIYMNLLVCSALQNKVLSLMSGLDLSAITLLLE